MKYASRWLSALALLAVFLTPSPSSAQQATDARIGLGWGPNSLAGLSGTGLQLQLTLPTPLSLGGYQLAVTSYAARGSSDGSPFSCVRVEQIYCFGRQDENLWLGISLDARSPLGHPGTGLYIMLPAPALEYRRSESTEHQGPTTLCFINGELVSCPDNPPFASSRATDTSWGIGLSGGTGLAASTAGLDWFIELRIRQTWDTRDGQTSAQLPIVVGVRF